jgi:hypothetical protein
LQQNPPIDKPLWKGYGYPVFGLKRLISSLVLGELALLEQRVDQLELGAAEDRLALLETMDKISLRLVERERKRQKAAEPTETQGTVTAASDRFLGAARRFGKS